MKLRRSLGPSLRALSVHKVRAGLALASIAVGVAAVILTSAMGKGAEGEVLRGIEGMGTGLLVVRPAQVKRLVARKAVQGSVRSLREADGNAISELAAVQAVVPVTEGALLVKLHSGSLMTKVVGTTPAFLNVKRFQLGEGRFFDDEDNDLARRVAVIGARLAETLVPGRSAVGSTIRIRGAPFLVVGVLEAKGVQADGSNEDSQVLIPARTALRRVFNSTWLSSVFVSVRDPGTMEVAEVEIRELLRERHRLARANKADDFAVQNRAKFLLAQKDVADTLTLFSTGLATVALVVGGVGILALMLLAVRERTPEIGLRRAVGARPRDILAQFLFEAGLLALMGWVVGAALGILGAGAIALGTAWKIAWPVKAIFASLIMATGTGFGFGALPARRASLMPPIRALAAK